jgi:hypothetical protein
VAYGDQQNGIAFDIKRVHIHTALNPATNQIDPVGSNRIKKRVEWILCDVRRHRARRQSGGFSRNPNTRQREKYRQTMTETRRQVRPAEARFRRHV